MRIHSVTAGEEVSVMSDVAANFALYRFIICLILGVGGIASIALGYHLFSKGAGLYNSLDKLAIKHNEFTVSMSGMSAGGFLMVTAIVWGYLSYSSRPTLDMASNQQGETKTTIGKQEPVIEPENPTVPKTDVANIRGKPLVVGNEVVGTVSSVGYNEASKRWVATVSRKGDNRSFDIDITGLSVDQKGSVMLSEPMKAVQGKDWLLQ
jgi:hypothetical protein